MPSPRDDNLIFIKIALLYKVPNKNFAFSIKIIFNLFSQSKLNTYLCIVIERTMITIIAFYPVSGKFDRHSFDTTELDEAFKTLLNERKNEGIKIYYIGNDMDRCLKSKLEQAGIFSQLEMECDYNDEELDGGFWMNVMPLLEEEIEKVLSELFS